jgi:hypothetical protein
MILTRKKLILKNWRKCLRRWKSVFTALWVCSTRINFQHKIYSSRSCRKWPKRKSNWPIWNSRQKRGNLGAIYQLFYVTFITFWENSARLSNLASKFSRRTCQNLTELIFCTTWWRRI